MKTLKTISKGYLFCCSISGIAFSVWLFAIHERKLSAIALIMSLLLIDYSIIKYLFSKILAVLWLEKGEKGVSFFAGNMVKPLRNHKYRYMENDYFKGKPLEVVDTMWTDYEYAGNQFVYVIVEGKEVGLYANALKKVNC